MYSREVYSPHVRALQMRRSCGCCTAGSKLGNVLEVIAPPPNITGELHLGHTLNLSLQKAYSEKAGRYHQPVECVLGLDHAGTATKYVLLKRYGVASLRGF